MTWHEVILLWKWARIETYSWILQKWLVFPFRGLSYRTINLALQKRVLPERNLHRLRPGNQLNITYLARTAGGPCKPTSFLWKLRVLRDSTRFSCQIFTNRNTETKTTSKNVTNSVIQCVKMWLIRVIGLREKRYKLFEKYQKWTIISYEESTNWFEKENSLCYLKALQT